jgi:hypothetical protein
MYSIKIREKTKKEENTGRQRGLPRRLGDWGRAANQQINMGFCITDGGSDRVERRAAPGDVLLRIWRVGEINQSYKEKQAVEKNEAITNSDRCLST